MKTFKIYSLVLLSFLLANGLVYGQEAESTLAPKERWSLETVEGKVTEINKETREITLMSAEGGAFYFYS